MNSKKKPFNSDVMKRSKKVQHARRHDYILSELEKIPRRFASFCVLPIFSEGGIGCTC